MSRASLFIASFLALMLVMMPRPVQALTFELVAPSGQLSRGQDVQFIVTINTGSSSLTTTQIGLTYQTQYLEYVSTIPGEAMDTVSVSQLSGGQLLLSGQKTSGFTGKGNFAYVNFKIIAEAPGTSELCSLWAPSPTTGATATPAPNATATPAVPLPTRLPESGGSTQMGKVGMLGTVFLLAPLGMYFLVSRRNVKRKHR
jgi:hypothetical protein